MIARDKLAILDYKAIEARLLERELEGRFPRLKELPPPDSLKGIKEACELITRAMKQQKSITVIGDYDVDGIVASAILSEFFAKLNCPIEVIIPNRFSDGYGLSPKLIEKIHSDLIITVDNGIMAHESAQICKDRGIQLIITDHHAVPEVLPDADVIINPKQKDCPFPQKEICGANVAWYLCAGLKAHLCAQINLGGFLDFLAFAIVADVMPLVEINRLLLKQGLKELSKSQKPPILALKERLKKEQFNAQDIAFFIAPLLNSAGRMEDASLALAFLLSPTVEVARERLMQLHHLNSARKEIEAKIFNEALEQIDPSSELICVHKAGWHEGVLGIVASRLCEHFGRPAFVLSTKEGALKGSGRSVDEVDLIALLHAHAEVLLQYGGHKGAVGIHIEKARLEEFVTSLCADLRTLPRAQEHTCDCMGELAFMDINKELLGLLERFEPYGEGNPRPKFLSQAKITRCKQVGANHTHTSLVLRSGTHELRGIAFSQIHRLAPNETITCLFSLAKDGFSAAPQLIIEKLQSKQN